MKTKAKTKAKKQERRGNGRIARLPNDLRDRLNQMLLNGVPYKGIIAALNLAPLGINKDSLSNWKKGKHKLWLLQLERRHDLATTREDALGLLKIKAGTPVQDASRTIAANQLYELLLSFEPSGFAAALVEKPELYVRLVNAVARLCECGTLCSHRRAMRALLKSKTDPKSDSPAANVVGQQTLGNIAEQIKLV